MLFRSGVTPVTVDHPAIKRVRDWIWTLPPPAYPYSIDRTLATRGADAYQRNCLQCHGLLVPLPHVNKGDTCIMRHK